MASLRYGDGSREGIRQSATGEANRTPVVCARKESLISSQPIRSLGNREEQTVGETVNLAGLILVIATLYAAVGQAGASGYLAVMGIVSLDPAVMKPVALALNLLVAAIGTVRFARAGLFRWRTFYPFGMLGVPFSFAGGLVHLPTAFYYPVVGGCLLLAGLELTRSTWTAGRRTVTPVALEHPPFWPALATGAGIGFLSGMTGTGGGIFLAPLILLMGWVETRRTAAVSAAFNLLNSAAALLGAWATLPVLPPAMPVWLASAGVGGMIGAWLGSRHLPVAALRYLLSAILVASGVKMLMV